MWVVVSFITLNNTWWEGTLRCLSTLLFLVKSEHWLFVLFLKSATDCRLNQWPFCNGWLMWGMLAELFCHHLNSILGTNKKKQVPLVFWLKQRNPFLSLSLWFSSYFKVANWKYCFATPSSPSKTWYVPVLLCKHSQVFTRPPAAMFILVRK